MKFILSILLLFTCVQAAQAGEDIQERLGGFYLIARAPEQAEIEGVRTTPAPQAMEILKAAVRLMMDKSPFVTRRLDRLQQNGKVAIIYDATLPRDTLTNVNIAAYFPEFYNPQKGENRFIIGVGRTGIQWEVDHLAAVLAHETAGHAFQDLEGRLRTMRLLDAECEAYLIQEHMSQLLDIPNDTREAIGLRQELDYHWCDDFRRHMVTVQDPSVLEWDQASPDVMVLLDVFEDYLEN